MHDPSGRVQQQSIDNLAMQGVFCFLLCAIVQAHCTTKNKKPFSEEKGCLYFVAVREGFEPSVQLPVRQFSKLFLSASQAPHPFLGIAKVSFLSKKQKVFLN